MLFHTIFREVAGCTLIVYVTRARIQIAMDCGFQSLSRFYDAFKSITGKTPRKVRADG